MKVTWDMVYGMSTYLSPNYDDPKPIPDFHQEMWKLCCDDHPKVAIAAPRNHAKSTAITAAYALTVLLFRQHQYILIVADTQAQADDFVKTIAKELRDNEQLIKDFKIKEFLKDTGEDIEVACEDGYEFKVKAKGTNSAMRGVKWNHKRPDLILCDDLENDEIVMNQDRRDKCKDWMVGALLPVRARKGKVRIVGTILHFDSYLMGLMPEKQLKRGMAFKNYIVDDGLCVRSTYEDAPWKSVRFRAHNDDFSKILWQDQWSKEELEAERADFTSQGKPEKYAQEYLNDPIDASTAYFKQQDLRAIPDDKYNDRLTYYIGTDFAITEKTKRDFTVFIVAGMNSEGKLQVREVVRERMDGPGIVSTMFELQNKYRPEFFVVEKGTIWNAIKGYLDREMRDTGKYIDIKELPATGDKMARAQAIKTRMRVGMVEFDKEAYWYPALESEFLRFPKDAHDDMVDALSWVGLALKNLSEAPTDDEVYEDEWAEMWNESGYMYSGQSNITGY